MKLIAIAATALVLARWGACEIVTENCKSDGSTVSYQIGDLSHQVGGLNLNHYNNEWGWKVAYNHTKGKLVLENDSNNTQSVMFFKITHSTHEIVEATLSQGKKCQHTNQKPTRVVAGQIYNV